MFEKLINFIIFFMMIIIIIQVINYFIKVMRQYSIVSSLKKRWNHRVFFCRLSVSYGFRSQIVDNYYLINL